MNLTPEEAIDVIARHSSSALTLQREIAEDDDWEDYPDIGEQDWKRVTERKAQIVPLPSEVELTAAYEVLRARAQDA